MYAAVLCWSRADLTMVRADLCCLQNFACASITGYVGTAPTCALEVILGILLLHLEWEAEARASVE
jgi:hypothetical protein